MAPLVALGNMEKASSESISGSGLSPFSGLFSVFNPPTGFKLRLGAARTDLFVSGTFPVGSATIGFIRIPTFAPTSTTTAVQQFSTEIQYFQQNTDGLVIDIMANGGGSLCYGQTLATYLIPRVFQGVGEQLRATVNWQASFSSSLYSAKASGAPTWVTDLYGSYVASIKQALSENRGMTGGLPLCGVSFDVNPATASGKIIAYTKPILVLTDNFTLSTAESFTMTLQDNNRATIYGMRTDGGGGNVVGYNNVTAYSQGNSRVTQGLIQRLNPIAANGYPSMLFYDGVGIQPDIAQDYMTADNLASGGTVFVNGFTSAIKTLVGQ
jgi:C-terminal processing protease CtpA/Prc